MRGLIPRTWNHDLGQRQALIQLNPPEPLAPSLLLPVFTCQRNNLGLCFWRNSTKTDGQAESALGQQITTEGSVILESTSCRTQKSIPDGSETSM